MRHLLAEMSGHFDSTHAGHFDVSHNDIGLDLLGKPNKLQAITRLSDHVDIGLSLQQRNQPFPDDTVVVANNDSNLHDG